MPIPATRTQNPDAPSPGPLPPKPTQWSRTYVSITGREGSGEEIPLTGFSSPQWPAVLMQAGATGLDAPPYELHADDSPNLDGSIYRSARAAAREVMIPVYLHGIDRRTVRDLKHRLVSSLSPKKGYCVLKFVEGNDAPRYLYCYYKGGMEGSEETDQAGFTWKRFGIQLTAHDPYFYSDATQVARWQFGEGRPFLPEDEPFFPLRLSAGLVSGSEVSVTNPGDVEAWPTWELTGPIRSFEFTGTNGQSFSISPDVEGDVVPSGRTLTIDTRPGYKSLLDDEGKNYWPELDSQPQLWPIPEGRSTMGVSIVAGSGTATVKVSFRPRFVSF